MISRRLSLPAARVLIFALLAAVAAAAMPTILGAVADESTAGEPVIVHEPPAAAFSGRPIPVQATASCRDGAVCEVALYFRKTPSTGTLLPADGWTRIVLSEGEPTEIPESGLAAKRWAGEIPAEAVTTRGVDYFLEAKQDGQLTRSPATAYHHVAVTSPPLVTHVPPPFARVDEAVPIEITATCSAPTCEVTLHYQTTGTTSDTVLVENPQWPTVAMEPVGDPLAVGEAGRVQKLRAEIPASAVDSRGVDYFVRVRDGDTTSWWPGTTHQGYFVPSDGKRVAYQHLQAVEAPRLVHRPPVTAEYRRSVSIEARGNCPASRTCEARLYWRTTTKDLLETTEPDFESAPMQVRRVDDLSDVDAVEISGEIPASATDTRGVDYFFSFSDGATTAWWPGTSHVDGYEPVEGTRAGYQHVRVLDPPHVVTEPVPTARAGEDYMVEAQVTCVTETCEGTVHYTSDGLWGTAPAGEQRAYRSVEMRRVEGSVDLPVGEAATYRATIPASDVTTAGLAYYIEARDGYAKAYAPGTSYWGAYVPRDGTRGDAVPSAANVTVGVGDESISTARGVDLAFPVRVLEPPHPVHAPPPAADRYEPLPVDAASNCSYAACVATLHWLHRDGTWRARPMRTTAAPREGATLPAAIRDAAADLAYYSSDVPLDGTAGETVQYRITVSDEHASESTPTFSVTAIRGDALDAGACALDDGGVSASTPPCLGAAQGVEAMSLTPHLSSMVDATPADAVPGDEITLRARVENDATKVQLDGRVLLENHALSPIRISAYDTRLEYLSESDGAWHPVAGAAAARDGYTPRTQPSTTEGLELTVAPQERSTATYPGAGDRIVNTQISATSDQPEEALAEWRYQGAIDLSEAQLAALLSSTEASRVRVAFHVEAEDADGRVLLRTSSTEVTRALRTQDGEAKDVEVDMTRPFSGETVTFDDATEPGLASVGRGERVDLVAHDRLPALPERGASETEDAYRQRLAAVDGDLFTARTTARATAAGAAHPQYEYDGEPLTGIDADLGEGDVREAEPETDPARPVAPAAGDDQARRVLPIIGLQKTGPQTALVDTTVEYSLALHNSGSADAAIRSLTDRVGREPERAVAARPDQIAAGQSVVALHPYAIPGSRAPGPLGDIATVEWEDRNDNRYGPLTDTHTTEVTRPAPPPADANPSPRPSDQFDFLFSGEDPIQTGVSDGTIKPLTVSVLRGSVRSRAGAPLGGVKVSVIDHPEYGETRTQADGEFYLAVNAGQYRLHFEKDGYIAIERALTSHPRDYAFSEDVALVQRDSAATAVQFASTMSAAQVHRATTMSDQDGTRAVTFVVQPGTEATMRMPDGSTQPLASGTVRATEFTVGASGEAAMPAELPPTTAYTFAAEFSVDEAEAVGAEEVRFSHPMAGYLENFLAIPVGELVPAGTYDENRGAWLADKSGRVVKVLAEVEGAAQLDVDGSGQAASQERLDALGVTPAELQRVAELYNPGAELWRVPVEHFSSQDWNWPPPDTDPAAGPPTGTIGPDPGDCGSTASGSIIGCEDQTLGEVFSLTGAPFALHYQSERMPGRTAENALEIPLSGSSLPGPVERIEVEVEVAGRRERFTRPAEPNQSYSFSWDGKDAFGRAIDTAPVTVRVGYAYDGRYRGTSEFGQPPGATSLSYPNSAARRQTVFWQVFRRTLGRPSARDAALGGMSLSVHHAYDTVTRTLYYGSGGRRSAESLVETISNFAGKGEFPSPGLPIGDGGLAKNARTGADAVQHAPDGSVYIADGRLNRVRRVRPDGIIETVAGTGEPGSAGDGGPATAAQLYRPRDLALGPDGSLVIAEGGGCCNGDHGTGRIRQVRPDGTIHTLAHFADTNWMPYGVAVAPDGTVYYTAAAPVHAGYIGYSRVNKITPDGRDVVVVPPDIFQSTGDGGPAADAKVYQPGGIDVAPDGSIYFTETASDGRGRYVVRRISPDGIIDRVAGTGERGDTGDGGSALDARVAPKDVAVAPDGSLFILSCSDDCRVRRVGTDRTIATVAGGGSASGPGYGDGGPARQAELAATASVDVAADGSLYVGDSGHSRVRRVSPPLPGYTDGELAVASTDGSELYVFDRDGRHLETKSTLTGATLWTFSYENGRLSDVTDGDGNNTYIERGPDGRLTGIVAPDGERTRFTSTADGLVGSVTDPAGGSFGLVYRAGGLLELLRDPEGNQTIFDYDERGRLIRDDDAAGGYQTLSRADARGQFEVTRQTRLGLATKYQVASSADGTTTNTVTGPDGVATTTVRRSDGSARRTQPDGSTFDAVQAGDPRYGMQAAFPGSVTGTTPGGLGATVTTSRSVTRPEPDNPLSLSTLTQSRTSAGKTATTVFDRSLSRVTFTSAAGRTQATTVDAQGRPVAATVPGVNPVSYTYDQRGRLQLVTQGERFQRYAYDERGNVESTADATGRVTRYAYDAANRVTATTLPDGRVISFAYNRNGDLVSVTPPSRPAHELGRTPVRALGHYTAPDAGQGADQTSYVYDFDRRLTGVTRPDGKQLTLGYDAAGRLDAVTEPGARTTSLAYDPQTGSLKRVTTPDGVVTELGFDGPLPTSTTASGPVAGAVAQSYDGEWRLNEATVNGQSPVAYAYDQDDLLTGAGDLALARRPDNGLLAGTTLGSLTTSHGYDAYGDLESHDAAYAQQSVFAQSFQRDAAGRITSKTEVTSTGSHTYAYRYDQAGRLEEVSRDGGQAITSYSYDANGNRSSVTRDGATTSASYDAQDRLSAYGGVQYEYTRAGELLRKTDGQAVTAYDYDTLGNLDRVELPDGQAVEYLWDGLGRRVGRKVDGQLTHGWLWGEWDGPVAEVDAQGAVRSRFVYGTRSNVPDYMVRDGRTYRLVTDHLASPRLVIDTATGEIAQELDYDEYGRTLRDTNPGFQPFGYAGGLYDAATGLVRFGARDYDPETGRWTSKDPILFDGGDTNLYGYVLTDPINLVDPSGLIGIPGFVEEAAGFASNAAAGALNEITFGGSNQIAGWALGFDPACAQFGPGYGTGSFLGNLNPKGLIQGAVRGAAKVPRRRLPRRGKPDSTEALDRGDGKGQIREYGPDSEARKDFDFGHDHGAGDPHAHDWIDGVRQPGRPIGPGE